jgi:hypothetical protein
MAIASGDRVQETTTTTGTGAITLGGAAPGAFQTFATRFQSGQVVPYTITDNVSLWEVGQGTLTTGSPNTLSRDIVYDGSSGPETLVNFGAGSKNVWSDLTANDVNLPQYPRTLPSGFIQQIPDNSVSIFFGDYEVDGTDEIVIYGSGELAGVG